MMTAAQRRAIHPQSSVWVTASAGSGKTKVLTDRLLALLMAGSEPHRLLCLTFTKAAAAEMANRLHQRLGEWAIMPEDQLEEALSHFKEGGAAVTSSEKSRARQLFSLLLETPGGFKIQTLHSFCQSLLRRFPLEAGLAPHFTVLDERTSQELLKKAQDGILNQIYQGNQGPLALALQQLTRQLQENRLTELVYQGLTQRSQLRELLNYHGSLEAALLALEKQLHVDAAESEDQLLQELCVEKGAFQQDLPWIAATLQKGTATDQEKAGLLRKWIQGPRPFLYPTYRRLFLTDQGAPRKQVASAALLKEFPNLEKSLHHLQESLLVFEEKRKTVRIFQNSRAFLIVMTEIYAEYERLKTQRAVLDYDDLINKTVHLLTERAGSSAWVLYKLDGGIDHILVDEAQDTSPDQWRVIQALSSEFFTGASPVETKTLFVVGDPKQSIYRFQGADPQSFEKMQATFRKHVQEHQQRWDDVELDVSFRSAPAILEGVDAVFQPQSMREGVSSGRLIHFPCVAKENLLGMVDVWPLVPLPEKPERDPWTLPLTPETVRQPYVVLAEGIASAIEDLLRKGEILHGYGRPIRAGDILILVRRRNAFMDTLVRFLKEKNIPVAGVDRLLFLEQLAIKDLVCLGECLLLPEDDLTLATVLKGPLIGLTEDELFSLAHGRGKRSLWSVLRRRFEEQKAPFADAYSFLMSLREKSRNLSPYAFYQMLLGPLKGRQKILGRLGLEAQDPLDELLNLALSYEQSHPPSLQGFLAWLSRGEVEVKRDFEHSLKEEIRIMTVHGSKGLQAPVVILPDTCQPPRSSSPFFWHKGERGDPYLLWGAAAGEEIPLIEALKEEESILQDQEYRRLLYVAMTRAEERLYICGWKNTKNLSSKSWYSAIAEQMKTHPKQETLPFSLPFSKTWTGDGHRLKTGTPTTLSTEIRDISPRFKKEDLPSWAMCPPLPEPSPAPFLSPSQGFDHHKEEASSFSQEQKKALSEGTILHRLLQWLPQMPSSGRRSAAEHLLTCSGFLEAEKEARLKQILHILEAPEFSFLFSKASQAEVSIAGKMGEQDILGQVDRIVVDENTVKIVDFKTGRAIPQTESQIPKIYLQQMAAYQAVIQPLYPQKTVLCGILWITSAQLQWIPQEILKTTQREFFAQMH